MPGVIKCKCPHLAYHAYSQRALEATYLVSVTGGRAAVPAPPAPSSHRPIEFLPPNVLQVRAQAWSGPMLDVGWSK